MIAIDRRIKEILAAGVILLSIGLPFICIGFQGFVYESNMTRWEKTGGTVLHSRVFDASIQTEEGVQARFIPEVTFQYSVDGHQWTSNRLSNIYDHYYLPESVEKIIQHYPAGTEVTVLYDPQNPSEAILTYQNPSQYPTYLFIFFGLALILTSVVCFVSYYLYSKGCLHE
ncbi:MAG: DUF3592 domain-containing protein [Candidatus Omnitrophica bacterium]|nr:DUF3592 domain-containing protein [Candidatus Omnitrophota bacterium]